jgi:hypothetical protein
VILLHLEFLAFKERRLAFRSYSLFALMLASLVTSGCATLSREGEQTIDVVVRDMEGRQVPARCTVINGSAVVSGNAPMFHLPVDRSASDIKIECQPVGGLPVARAVVVSHSVSSLMMVVQPVASTVIDHLSGRMYQYPERIVLVSGRSRVYDSSGDGDVPTVDRAVSLGNVAERPHSTSLR